MADELFNVIFRGEILPGFNATDVKARFGQLFKMEAARVEGFFSGKPVVLKPNCDRATADKFTAVLQQAGVKVEVRSTQAAASAQPTAPAPAQPVAQPRPVAATAPAAAPAPASPAPAARVAAAAVDPWSVAPVGRLVRPDELHAPEPVQVDISHISLFKRNPFSTDDEPPLEEDHSVPPPPLDLSGFSVGEPGEQLVPLQAFVPLDIDLSALTLDPPGTEVLSEAEREQFVPVTIDTSELDVAPAGGVLGQIAPPPAPPPPPTDHISVQK